MKCMLVISCLVALAAANPGYLAGPAAYAAVPVAHSAIVAPGAITSQFHTQDTLGQYAYGYQGDTSAKQEVRTADGITQGAYSYLDAHGLVQSASYVSDPINGFRVAATNLPTGVAPAAPAVVAAAPAIVAHAPAVAAAPAVVAHAPAVAAVAGPAVIASDAVEITAARAAHLHALLGRRKRSPGYLGSAVAAPLAVAHSAIAPVAVAHAAPVAVAHAAPIAVAHAAPVAVAPVSTFGYSSVSAHPPTVVGYTAHVAAAPVAYAHAAPAVAVAHAAPVLTADAAHIAAKAALLGRKKRSPGYLHAPLAAVAAPVAYAAPLAYAAPISTTTYAHAPIVAY